MVMNFYISSRGEHDSCIEKLITLIHRGLNKPGIQVNIEREIGQILRYRTEDIEFYIAQIQRKIN